MWLNIDQGINKIMGLASDVAFECDSLVDIPFCNFKQIAVHQRTRRLQFVATNLLQSTVHVPHAIVWSSSGPSDCLYSLTFKRKLHFHFIIIPELLPLSVSSLWPSAAFQLEYWPPFCFKIFLLHSTLVGTADNYEPALPGEATKKQNAILGRFPYNRIKNTSSRLKQASVGWARGCEELKVNV